MNPRSSLTRPGHQERRWWWKTLVIYYQLTLVKPLPGSWCLPTPLAAPVVAQMPAVMLMLSLSLALTHEYLCIFIQGRIASQGLTETPTLEMSVPRGCDTLCSSGRPLHHVSWPGDANLCPWAGGGARGTGSTPAPCLSPSNVCMCCITKHSSLPQDSKHHRPWTRTRVGEIACMR